ncbi:MAG: TetR/AcrR family transcriptional regulator C-terminal domain-containing protein [Eubacteriales bacterium]|nr:TetR/AcrR family transcriptional regulator C-terminal domain-containing protein [Eubacteriales bacterium]
MSNMTKKALAASLKKMMEQKPLAKITVTDITEDCGLNRHTFYYHFQDIYDLVEWIYLTESENAVGGEITADTWEEGMRKLLMYAQENKKFIIGTYKSMSRDYLQKFLHRQMVALVSLVIDGDAQDIQVSEECKSFVINFYAYAFEGVFLSWIDSDMKQDPEKLLSMLVTMVQGEGRAALRKFEGR